MPQPLQKIAPPRNKILWAVDALSPCREAQLRTLRSLEALFPNSGKKIEPVYVIKSDDLDFSAEIYTLRGYAMCPQAESNLNDILAGQRSNRLLAPQFLTQKGNSKKIAAQTLIRHALENGHEMIAVTATPSNRIVRYFRKCFIDHLLHLSPIPILVTNAKAASESISHVVFATNKFSESKAVFEIIASRWGGLINGVTVFIGTDRKWHEQELWNEIAHKNGISLELRFNPSKQMGVEQILAEMGKLTNPLLIFDYENGFGLDVENANFPVLMIKPHRSIRAGTGPQLRLISGGSPTGFLPRYKNVF